MTEGEDPLVCSCGLHSATYVPARKKQKARWIMLSARVGQKPQPITNLITKSKALDRVTALCAAAATGPSVKPTTATPPYSTASQPHLRQQPTIKYGDTARTASKPAGPGRGHTGKRPATPLDQADAVLKKPRASAKELRDALALLSEEHRLLQRWYGKVKVDRDRAYALLRDDYLLGADEKADCECKQNWRAIVTELVGKGYDFSGSGITFRRHKALALGCIKQLAGPNDTVGQQQLAEALLCHYKDDKEAAVEAHTPDYEAHAAVIAGLVETLETLRKRNNGKFPTKDRITQEVPITCSQPAHDCMLQVILSAVVSTAKGKMLRAISRLLKQSRSSIIIQSC